MRIFGAALAAVAGLGMTSASAADETGITESAFVSLDIDRNGELNMEELAAFPSLQARFGYLDGDASGALTLREFRGLVARPANPQADRAASS